MQENHDGSCSCAVPSSASAIQHALESNQLRPEIGYDPGFYFAKLVNASSVMAAVLDAYGTHDAGVHSARGKAWLQ